MLKSGTIEELKSIVSKGRGFARTNLYYVYLPSFGSENSYEYGVLCTSVQMPSRQLTTVQREIGVSRQDVVYGYVNPSVTMTFRVLNDQGAREYFEKWQRKALRQYDDIEGRYESNYADEYCKKVEIYQLERGVSFPIYDKQIELGPINLNFDIDIGTSFEKNYKWTLDRAFPISVTNETFSDGASNEISTISVDFSYHFWEGTKLNTKNRRGNAVAGILGSVASNI